VHAPRRGGGLTECVRVAAGDSAGARYGRGVIVLPESPTLTVPTNRVKTSYLVGEQADMIHRGSSTDWLHDASQDFEGFVADQARVKERMGVPSEVFWFTAAEYYIGSLVIRHRLADGEHGGHIGYHVVYPWQRQGHATSMLREALRKCEALGIQRALLTVAPQNEASLTVVRRNGGVGDGVDAHGELRFWIDTTAPA
jgi:predicted acetyltransferase